MTVPIYIKDNKVKVIIEESLTKKIDFRVRVEQRMDRVQ